MDNIYLLHVSYTFSTILDGESFTIPSQNLLNDHFQSDGVIHYQL